MRLPIKIDLRDLATWLNGRDPFTQTPSEHDSPTRSLESFIARLISWQSGGIDFTPFDVTQTLSGVPTLLFLDGLDEVADIDTRKQLVDAVRHGSQRMQAQEILLQIIVTSRPAAFANSPGLPIGEFTFFELQNIQRPQISEYTDHWIRARNLDDNDARDVRRILHDKLDLPHIRDLARNPMQLAILLGLILSVGYSLPDERTELYSSYMQRFLTREAEKSATVRKHRMLLVKLHQHLAWVLQGRSEVAEGTSGSVGAEELRGLLRQYLLDHEYSLEILDDLFHGMLERVYVLVQRIEGSYEFEVQPLREFFCAMHLYDTAAPDGTRNASGSRVGGNKLERFDALARNPYWTNVTRFFAGRFTSGELGSLYLQIEEMKEDEVFADTFRPRELGAMLLSDWVFKEHPRATRSLVSCIFDDLGIKGASMGFTNVGPHVSLPLGGGRLELAECLVDVISHDPRSAFALEAAQLLGENLTSDAITKMLGLAKAEIGEERTRWITLLARAGMLNFLQVEDLRLLALSDRPLSAALVQRAGDVAFYSPGLAEQIAEVTSTVKEETLKGRSSTGWEDGESWLNVFMVLASPFILRPGLQRHIVFRMGSSMTLSIGDLCSRVPTAHSDIAEFIRDTSWLLAPDVSRLSTSLEPANRLVESMRHSFGDTWAGFALASQAAGIKSRHERASGAVALFDNSVPLVSRARYARLRGGGGSWWKEQLGSATSRSERKFWALMLTVWGAKRAVLEAQSLLEEELAAMDDADFHDLLTSIYWITSEWRDRRRPVLDPASGRLELLFEEFANEDKAHGNSVLVTSSDPLVQSLVRDRQQSQEVREVMNRPLDTAALDRIRDHYAQHGFVPPRGRTSRRRRMNADAARLIVRAPREYPIELVREAETFVRSRIATPPLAEVARSSQWTFE